MSREEYDARFHRIYILLWSMCAIVALLAFVFYRLGFRLSDHFAPVRVGNLTIELNTTDVQMTVDNHDREVIEQGNFSLLKNLTPGIHSIFVTKDGYWPWVKTIDIPSNQTRSVFAFIFPMQGATTTALSHTDGEYKKAIALLSQTIVPAPIPDSPAREEDESLSEWLKLHVPTRILSDDKSTALFVEDNTIYLAWISDTDAPPHYFCEEHICRSVLPIMVSTTPIKNIAFYKGRHEAVVFASGSALYVIEADRNGTQNFQPFFKGVDPVFAVSSEGMLYVKDKDVVSKVNW